MTDETINDARTVAGNAEGTRPAGPESHMDKSIGEDVTIRPKTERGARAFAPGDVVAGRYVVEQVLGEGGMGIVYKCLDRVGGVTVAVKCLPPEVSRSADEMEDIRANYRLVADLHHPNIAGARTLEMDEATGDYYLVMDLARGMSLKRWMKRNPQATMEAKLAILRQAAAALDYAHARKVIHRDVKPENVMVDDAGGVKVLDFGLAAQIRSSRSRTSKAVTDRSGTWGYMSPEQWRGKPQREQADVYSFGVMAYWMFAGELPFEGDDPAVLGPAVLTEPVEPIPDLPAHMNAALVKALAKAPENRFAGCGAFMDALEGKVFSRGEHVERVEGAVGSRVPRDRAGGSRSRAAVKGLLAAALALAVIGGWWYYRQEQVREQVRIATEAVRPKAAAEEAKRKAEEDAAKQRPDDAHQKAEDAKARMAKFLQLKTRINIKVSDAKEKMGRISEFRADPDGLETHIASADARWKVVSAIDTPTTLESARSALELADKAETQISLDLDWLQKNKTGRDAAKAAEVEIKNLLEGDIATFKAERYAPSPYGEGADLRTQGQAAFKNGDFDEAGKLLDGAKVKFAEALQEAKAFFVKTTLQSAQTYFDAEKWQDCIAEADKVLGWDADNESAVKLKTDAESHLVPTLQVVAKIDGRDISGAIVKMGDETFTTPFVWKLKEGSRYGPYAVSFESGGNRYSGTIDSVTVDWRGSKVIPVVLKEYKGPKEGDVKTFTLPGDVRMEMVYVDPGSFQMGSSSGDKDETAHRVRLTKGYWIGKYPVTQAQWNVLVSAMGVSFGREGQPVAWFSKNGVHSDVVSGMDTSDFPMENISWDDCKALVDALNKADREGRRWALPTEAQWEFAARGGNKSRGYTYSGGNNMAAVGWYYENSGVRGLSDSNWKIDDGKSNRCRPHSIKEKDVGNELGIVSMSGNVWEWCNDRYGRDYYSSSPTEDPQGPASGEKRVLRGGSWIDPARNCRPAPRCKFGHGNRNILSGFRLCCFVEPREGGAADGHLTEKPTILNGRRQAHSDVHDKVQLWKNGPYWATTNIGAEKPEDSGYHFWWGDTVGYKYDGVSWVASDGSARNFTFNAANAPTYLKDHATLLYEGWITSANVLAPAHDAAYVHWGGNWRMPTKQELDDLVNKCDWNWTTVNRVNGYVVRGRGDYASKSIFLPRAGYDSGASFPYYLGGYYWSSVPISGCNSDYHTAWSLELGLSKTHTYCRCYGLSVRPVQGFTK